MTLKERLRTVRSEHALSQEELAERLDVSRQTICKWERGTSRPSADNLTALSEVYGIPVDALLKDDWTPPVEPEPIIQVVEVPASRSWNYCLWALLAALVLAGGIVIGVFFFREQPEDSVSESTLEGEVIGDISSVRNIPILPFE
ncbi:MAG: helix-turn-helix transcriptional regulator [Lawsonibacter sp.]|nr:helix-turn-helix transcriptional regulator [Lawsonibacter sp.]